MRSVACPLVSLVLASSCASPEVRPAVPPAPHEGVARQSPRAPTGHVERLAAPRRSPHAYGREGDLVLVGATGARITFAAGTNTPGHRPLRGAMLDLSLTADDASDPLLWWMPGVADAMSSFHAIDVTDVTSTPCEHGDAGVHITGRHGAVTIVREVCALPDGRFSVSTRANGTLPPDTHLADDLVVGTSQTAIDGAGTRWETIHNTAWIALSEHRVATVIESTAPMRVARRPIRIASEVFPAPITVYYDRDAVSQTLTVARGDALDAIALAPGPRRTFTVNLTGDHRAEISLLDAHDEILLTGDLTEQSTRSLSMPIGFASAIRTRDERGVVSRVALDAAATQVTIPNASSGRIRFAYHDAHGAPLPVHVLFRGLDGTPDPEPRIALPNRAAARSVYLLDGRGEVSLAHGRYRVTATHGITHTLSAHDVEVGSDDEHTIDDTIREVVDTHEWVSGDFHLHAAPSPDSTVSLEERVLSLVCEGVDVAVATDHNRITDYAPAVAALGVSSRIDTIVGNEITPSARLWGHFNAYPLPVPTVAPEDAVSVYYDQTPAAIFAAARASGARIIQVNHARMEPNIGYFDLTQFDARTGRGGEFFNAGFDAFEAFNGIWLETPAKVREGLRDLVGLVRAGIRPAAMGNSDSHQLLFEEAGYPRTFVHTPSLPVNTRGTRVVDALLRGDTTLSSGPFVEIRIGESGPGSTVRTARNGRVRVHVRVQAPAWVPVDHVEIWVDDTVARRIEVTDPERDGVRFERDIDLVLAHDAVIAAWADADTALPSVLPYPNAHAIGFTGLVYVDRDGDGAVRLEQGASPAPH